MEWSPWFSPGAGGPGSRDFPYSLLKILDLVEDLLALGHVVFDFSHGVDDGGVVAVAEGPADLGVGKVGHVPGDVHGDLAGVDERSAPAASGDLLDREVEELSGGLENAPDSDRRLDSVVYQVGQHAFGEFIGTPLTGDIGVCSDLDQGALELADRIGDVLGDERENFGGDLDGCGFSLLLEDGQPGDQVGRLDVGDEA